MAITVFFFTDHLFHRDLFERQVDDHELRLRGRRPPGLRAGAVDDQQHQASDGRVLRGKLGGDLGVSVPVKRVVRIDHREVVFGLVRQRIGAMAGDDQVFNAIAVEVRLQLRRPRHQLASRSKLFLDEVVVHRGGGRRCLLSQSHK